MGNIKTYRLLGADKKFYQNNTKGEFGGHNKLKIYGKLNCQSALGFIAKGQYVNERVFFQDEQTAINAGFRPCHRCMKEIYKKWNAGGDPGTKEYPWLVQPKEKLNLNA